MAVLNNKKWMITFHYEQDLRSYYMNGVLSGILHPGVYNANMFIHTIDPDGTSTLGGVYLYIKKGTTFIFSNSYEIDNNSSLRRNLNFPGDYVIKAVAMEDIDVELLSWSGTEKMPAAASKFLGSTRQKNHFIMAKMVYNPLNDINKSEGGYSGLEPNIFLVDKNPEYTGAKEDSRKVGRTPYFTSYQLEDWENYEKKSGYIIPEGIYLKEQDGEGWSTFTASSLSRISWLCLGKVTERKRGPNLEENYVNTYLDGGDDSSKTWKQYSPNETTSYSYSNIWVNNHVFTARGLEEYRYPMYFEQGKMYPDFYLNPFNTSKENPFQDKLFLDTKAINLGRNIYNFDIDFRKALEVQGKDSPGFDIISPTSTPQSGQTIFNMVCLGLRNTKVNLKPSAFNSYLENYKGDNDSFNGTFDNLFPSNIFTKAETYPEGKIEDLFTITWTTNQTIDSFDYHPDFTESEYALYRKFLKEGQLEEGEVITHKNCRYISPERRIDNGLQDKLKNRAILPLDISIENEKRLMNSFLYNTNFLNNIVSLLTFKDNDGPKDLTGILPICITYRQFKNYEGSEKIYSTDGYSTETNINPTNVLSFLDLNYRNASPSYINYVDNDVYSIIPIIE